MKEGLSILVIAVFTLVMGVYTFMANSESVNPQTISVFDNLLKFVNTWGT